MDAVNNPEDPDAGTRRSFSQVLYIEQEDFREDPPNSTSVCHLVGSPAAIRLFHHMHRRGEK